MNPEPASIPVRALDALPRAASELLSLRPGQLIFAFNGPMGAGKTTLIKELCKHLGVEENTSSPTYSLVNEYRTRSGETIYHFDFYRIRNLQEALNMGFEEYLDSGAYCFIEWPERVEPLLPEGYTNVTLSISGDERLISVS